MSVNKNASTIIENKMDGMQTWIIRDEPMSTKMDATCDEAVNGKVEEKSEGKEIVSGESKNQKQNKSDSMDKAIISPLKVLTSEAARNSPQKSGSQSLSKTKSQSDNSDTRAQIAQWWQSRQRGSPRKYHQGLKQTGLLMNASKSYPIMASPKKKTSSPSHKSPSQTSPNTSPLKESARKALFRHIPGTYLENLRIVVSTVMSEPQDVSLLGEVDIGVITSFKELSLAAQKLYVRLLQRKLDLKRLPKVVYEDVCEPQEMGKIVQELVDAGFFLKEEDLGGLPEFLEVLSVAEVQVLCKEMKVPARGKKEDIVKALINFSKQQPSIQAFFALSKFASKRSPSPLLKRAKEMVGPCLKLDPEVHRVFMRVLMLYGLPSYDDMEEGGPQATLTALLLINLGKMRFPAYTTNRMRTIFRTRDDLLRFENCCHINMEVQKCVQDKKWEEALQHCKVAKDIYLELTEDDELLQHDRSLPRFLRRFTAISLLVYILSASVEFLQKVRQYEAAVDQLVELLNQDIYLQDHRGLWYARLALNLHSHLRKPAKALEVIEKGLKDPELQHAHRLTLSTRARRLARNDAMAKRVASLALVEPVVVPKVVIQGRSLHGDIPGCKRAFIRQDSDRHAGEGAVTLCSVEELVIGHYQGLGYPEGLHMEGTTVRSLFGLLFWEELYTPVPDAFRSPHQASPLDLLDEHFYLARKELIDKRLGDMRGWSEKEVDAEIERVWWEHEEEQCLVSWNIFSSPAYVQGLVKSLGLEVLAAVFERLAKNYRHTRSGFPDLIVWNPNTKKARIVEVKGPNDTLSVKQEVWLDYLVSCGAVAEVCHVEAIGAKKMTKASPRKASPKKKSPKKTGKRANDSDDDDDQDEDYVYRGSKNIKRSKTSDDDSLDEECNPPELRKSVRRNKNNSDDSDEDFVCPSPKKTAKKTSGDTDDDSLDEECNSPQLRKSVRRNKKDNYDSDEDFVCPSPKKTAKKTKDNEYKCLRPRRSTTEKTARGRRGRK